MERVDLAVEGMSCGHCVSAVRSALGKLDGVEVEQVNIGAAAVRFDPARASRERIVEAIEDEGYQVRDAAAGAA